MEIGNVVKEKLVMLFRRFVLLAPNVGRGFIEWLDDIRLALCATMRIDQ